MNSFAFDDDARGMIDRLRCGGGRGYNLGGLLGWWRWRYRGGLYQRLLQCWRNWFGWWCQILRGNGGYGYGLCCGIWLRRVAEIAADEGSAFGQRGGGFSGWRADAAKQLLQFVGFICAHGFAFSGFRCVVAIAIEMRDQAAKKSFAFWGWLSIGGSERVAHLGRLLGFVDVGDGNFEWFSFLHFRIIQRDGGHVRNGNKIFFS